MKNSRKKGLIILTTIIFIISLVMSSILMFFGQINDPNDLSNIGFEWPENVYNENFNNAIDSYDGKTINNQIFDYEFKLEFNDEISKQTNVDINDFVFESYFNDEIIMNVTYILGENGNKNKEYIYYLEVYN